MIHSSFCSHFSLASQQLRLIAAELDPLRLGSGWNVQDLSKPQIIVESTYGHSHPGSSGLNKLVDQVGLGIRSAGGHAANYYCTDICDGEAQGHDGMHYSLVSREIMAAMIEIHSNATPFDAGVFIASCDKAVPAHLMSIARINIPSIFVPGGVMRCGPNNLTLEHIGKYSAQYAQHIISEEQYMKYKEEACPDCGACSFMGTASTMQVMSEALGLALPGSALIPSHLKSLQESAQKSGQRAVKLANEGLLPSKILTKKAFENAVMVHAAIAGSTNVLLHLPAIAHELGIDFPVSIFDEIHRKIPYLLNVRPSGYWPAEYFWYAGGVPAIMENIKSFLNLDVLTVTGKTVGENLDDLQKSGFHEKCELYLRNVNVKKDDVIKTTEKPLRPEGAIAVIYGNIAPEGAVVKHAAISPKMMKATLKARVFDNQKDALQAVIDKRIHPGDAVIIRYEGPKGTGMPEMFYTTEAIASDPDLVETTALLTDGRFSGATRGPAIGHISPEASEGGPIAFIEEGDLIQIDIPERKLDVVGFEGAIKTEKEVQEIFQIRRAKWIKPANKFSRGILALYTRHSASPMKGGYFVAEN